MKVITGGNPQAAGNTSLDIDVAPDQVVQVS
jgi:hypothetical protein